MGLVGWVGEGLTLFHFRIYVTVVLPIGRPYGTSGLGWGGPYFVSFSDLCHCGVTDRSSLWD